MGLFTGSDSQPQLAFMQQPTHVRSFESRSHDDVTSYTATGLSLAANGDYIVCDVGTDSVRVFSPQGRCKLELNTEPAEEPTSAVTVNLNLQKVPTRSTNSMVTTRGSRSSNSSAVTSDDCLLVACRTGLKMFSGSGQLLSEMTSDIKCPQCVVTDAHGNVIISDMLDGGSTIVTLDARTLIPVRLFCGACVDLGGPATNRDSKIFDLDPFTEIATKTDATFHTAWYMHVTRDEHVVISDREHHMIKCYTSRGEHVWSVGGFGARNGQFVKPAGIAEDALGHLLVADSGNNRIQVLSGSGDWLGVILGDHVIELNCPMDVALDDRGHVVVLEASGTVHVYKYLTLN